MKTFWRVLAVLVVFPAVSWAQIGKITSPSSGATPTANGNSTANYCADAGGTDAYACSLPVAPTLAAGLQVCFSANTANTGAATLALNGLSAVTIKRPTPTLTTDLETGDIRAGQKVCVIHDGTNFTMTSTRGNAFEIGGATQCNNGSVFIGDTNAAVSCGGNMAYTWSTGQLRSASNVLSASTMTAGSLAEFRSGTSSYSWTNAMVTSLGAALTGDINVVTLPAKTRLKNVYVVINTAAGGPATLTVSCGDAIGGTPFTNYIVASDAKAAANTVYGDAVAERGTSIDVEWYYLPSYTATTLVTCHFIATGANLDTVTTSTGTVILETELIP